LIYYEACLNEQDARQREKYLKSGMGKRYLKNRLKRFLFLTGFKPIKKQHNYFGDGKTTQKIVKILLKNVGTFKKIN